MQMRHSGVDKFVISWLRTKAPDIKTTTVVDRSRSAIKKSWACIVSTAFDVMIFYISLDDKFSSVICQDFECLKLALWPTLRQEFMNFWSFLTRPGDKHDKKISNCIALRLPSWSKPPNLMVCSEIFRNAMFICPIKTEISTVAE